MNEQMLEQRLAWYANGTLPEAERAEVEAWLAQNPEARLQLAEYEFLQETVAEVADDEPQLASDGFDQLMAQVDELEQQEQQAASQPAPERRQEAQPGLIARIQQWFQESVQWQLTPAFARVAVVAQFALVAVLGTVLVLPEAEKDASYEVLSGETTTVASDRLTVEVGFAPELTLAELQTLLQGWQATVVGGPNSLGFYRLELVKGSDLGALQNHDAVLYLQKVTP